MNLEGAISFSENDVSNIYTMNSSSAGQYCVIVPKNPDGVLSMLVDFSKKDLFDSLTNGTISKDDLLKEINEEYSKLRENYSSGMLIFPMMVKSDLDSAVNNDDKQKMFDGTKKIAAFTSDVYKKVIDSGVDKAKISQKIIIVENDETDSKFVTWLKEQQPNFVDSVKYDKPNNDTVQNNTVDVDIFGAPAVEPQPVTGDIFASNNVEEQVENVPEVESLDNPEVTQEPEVANNDIFGGEAVVDSVEPVNEIIDNSNDGINQETTDEQPMEPRPIENVSLNNETQPVNNTDLNVEPQPEQNVVSEATNEENDVSVDKKSGGFANLLILLVILAVVTVVSIEFGKFLFNTFNA